MKKVSVIGHFGNGLSLNNGQTIKTKIITDELKKELSGSEVATFDSHGGVLALLKAPFQCLKALRKSKNVLILPAYKGLRVYAPLLKMFRPFYKGRKLHYVVIGGWLPEFVKNKSALKRILRKFDGIYVETSLMKETLKKQGFSNIYVMPNFKNLHVLEENRLVYSAGFPLKLCTFSRVNRKKGIQDAVDAVRKINEESGRIIYSLNIYGGVDKGEEEWFSCLQKQFPVYISYLGVIPPNKSVDVLKDYFALLFPTCYFTEGIPGTILDAYASGVPVIASKWENYQDIIVEGETGLTYSFGDQENLKRILLDVQKEPKRLLDMKNSCLKEATRLNPKEQIKTLLNQLR